MTKPSIDLIMNGQGIGEVATYMQKNSKLDPNRKRPFLAINEKTKKLGTFITVCVGDPRKKENYKNIEVNAEGTLFRDEWKALDEAVIGVQRERLTGFDYFVNKGLVFNLTNAMGTTVLEWRSIGDSQEAIMSMDGLSRGQGDRTTKKHHYIPIPIIHVDYEINQRELETSRNMQNPIDTTEAEHATRRILELQDDMLFTNTSYSWGDKGDDNRNSIYSFLNFPDRNPVTLTKAWDESDKTPGEIYDDVVAMKKANFDAKCYGPAALFIPTDWDYVLDNDYSVSGGSIMTIRERLLKINGIQEIVPVDRLTANNAVLVQLKKETVRIINGMPIRNLQWNTEGGMVNKFKVMTIRVPQLRSDWNGNCGIAHLA